MPVRKGFREQADRQQRARAKAEGLGKAVDRKSTMFEYGTKEQQEAEIAKPRSLPALVPKQRDRRPKRIKQAQESVKEPVLSGEAAVKWAEAKRRAALKAVEAVLNKAKRRGKPIPPTELAKKTAPQAVLSRIERKARLQRPKAKHASTVAKAEPEHEEKHYGTRYGTKDPRGSLKQISEYKTRSGKIKSPPDSPKGREEMASKLIAHHHHHLGRHPGGRAQAIAIGLRQAGMSRGQARKAMGNEIIRESAEARLGEIFGAELDLSPVDLMKSMTLMSDADIMGSMGEIDKAMEEGDAVKAYMGFEKLKQKIAARGKVDNPAAVAAAIGRKKYGHEAFQEMAAKHETAPQYKKRKRGKKVEKGDPGGMSGYEKGVAMYGKEGMKKMATGHLTSTELQQTQKATPLPLPAAKGVRLVPEPAAKAYALGEPKKVYLEPMPEKKEKEGSKISLETAPQFSPSEKPWRQGKAAAGLGQKKKAEKALGRGDEEEYVPKDKPDISKQMGMGPSVGSGITAASGARPSVGMGKSKGDQKKAYRGTATFEGGKMKLTGGEPDKPMGHLPHEQPGFTPPSSSTPKPPPAPHEIHVGTSGGFTSKTPSGGPHIFTSAKPDVGGEAEPSMKPGSTLSLTSLKAPGSKSMGKAKKSMEDLMEMSKAVHGGKGPAKTGPGQWNCPNAGPAHRGVIDWDEEENQAGSGRAKTGAGTPHPPNAGPAKTGAGQVESPNAGPAQTGAGERHWPGREMGKALRASFVPRLPRAMAASLDTWRSATNVLTRTNAMLQPQAPLTPDPLADAGGRPSTHTEFYKSDLMRCENCGRAFAKSHGECPTCSMNKALTCKSCGASMHKGRDGELRCSACGQGTMKSANMQKYDIGPNG